MSLLGSPRRRWWLLAGGWVLLLVLGIGGYVQQSRDLALGHSTLDNIYLTLQLAALDFEGAGAAINWRLQVARFAAPVMAAGTLLQSASVVFREQFTRWRLRFLSGHTIVCGLGPAGTRIAVALAAAGRDVVAVTSDPSSPGIATARDHGIEVLVGDATDPEVLRAARTDRAASVVAVADDGTNVAITTAVAGVDRARSTALRCSVHLADADLAHMLRSAELGTTSPVHVEFFNLHERGARALLAEFPCVAVPGDDGGRPAGAHVVVLGVGQLGRSVVLAAAQQWRESGAGPLPVTLVDRAASGRYHALRLRHAGLMTTVTARSIDLDLGAPTEEAVDEFLTVLAEHPPSLVVVSFDDESLALSSALFVRRAVPDRAVRVVARTESDGGLGAIVGATGAINAVDGISPFPFLARACTVAAVEGGMREQLAHSMHDDHIARSGGVGRYNQPWEKLSDDERESSRRAADAIVERLASIGCELVPLRSWSDTTMPFSSDEVERLAADEHRRWQAEREAAGWTWGPTRDDVQRRNPLLVAWDDLSEPARQQNRDAVTALPSLLARTGFEVARTRSAV